MVIIRWLTAIVVLPGTVLLLVPSVILWFSRDHWKSVAHRYLIFWFALLLAILGASIALWTMGLFFCFGNGTAAPWDPPKTFVVRGPFRYVRNPMISAALTILLAEALFFQSVWVFIWFLLFLIGNLIYIPTIEEKQLAKRFGSDYLTYKSNVPRWIPRTQPWSRSPHHAG